MRHTLSARLVVDKLTMRATGGNAGPRLPRAKIKARM